MKNNNKFRKGSRYLATTGVILIAGSWIIGLFTNAGAVVFAYGLNQGLILLFIALILWLISLGKD